ncbi:MAG: hypothetical protein JSS49_07855 [Planctomycetes bacterium]|nr:hypothetical protein [Planctomycetota bacterium]
MMNKFIFSPVPRRGAVMAMLVLGLACGCGSSEKKPDASQQATISGKVTLDGSKPAPVDTDVVFYCSEKNATVAGRVDALGNYSVKAGDKSIGIPAGRYQVMVRPPAPPAPKVGTDDYKAMMMSGGAAKPAESASVIPTKFQAFDTSKIVLEVKAGNNPIDLDLSKL